MRRHHEAALDCGDVRLRDREARGSGLGSGDCLRGLGLGDPDAVVGIAGREELRARRGRHGALRGGEVDRELLRAQVGLVRVRFGVRDPLVGAGQPHLQIGDHAVLVAAAGDRGASLGFGEAAHQAQESVPEAREVVVENPGDPEFTFLHTRSRRRLPRKPRP